MRKTVFVALAALLLSGCGVRVTLEAYPALHLGRDDERAQMMMALMAEQASYDMQLQEEEESTP
jgi:hypothetical protein